MRQRSAPSAYNNGDAVGISRQVGEQRARPGEGGPGIDDALGFAQGGEEVCEGARIFEFLEFSTDLPWASTSRVCWYPARGSRTRWVSRSTVSRFWANTCLFFLSGWRTAL